jgi:hypothetical protein
MYTGKRFRLKEAVLGIERIEGRHFAVSIPSGETIVVLGGPKPNDMRMVDVRWGARILIMFFEDIQSRGMELRSNGTGSTVSPIGSIGTPNQDA